MEHPATIEFFHLCMMILIILIETGLLFALGADFLGYRKEVKELKDQLSVSAKLLIELKSSNQELRQRTQQLKEQIREWEK